MKEWLGKTFGVQGSSMLFSMHCSMFAVKHIYYPFFLKSCFMKCFLERLVQENWERLVGFLDNILWTECIKCFFSLCVLSRRCICHLIKTGWVGGKRREGNLVVLADLAGLVSAVIQEVFLGTAWHNISWSGTIIVHHVNTTDKVLRCKLVVLSDGNFRLGASLLWERWLLINLESSLVHFHQLRCISRITWFASASLI